MLNTLVAIVLGNAVVATLFALGVVLFARWCHKPALLHGLWVVVLLKLVTPPMLTIPIPVELPALEPAIVQTDETQAEPVSESALGAREGASASFVRTETLIEPQPTILIEPPLDAENTLPEGEIADQELLANLATAVAPTGETAPAPEHALPLPHVASPASSQPERGLGFPAATPAERSQPASPLLTKQAFSWRDGLWAALWVWGAGAVIVFWGAWRQILRFERSLRQAIPADRSINRRVEELSLRLGLSRPPVVLLVNGAVSPMLWGFGWTPRLLLPKELLSKLNAEAIDTLILHELAHMRRGDHWVRVLELLCQCVYWWHPVVWWGQRQLRIVEEECCDAFVVEHCQGGVYARALLATVDFLSKQNPVMPKAASGMGNLEFLKRRLTMIMQGGVSARLRGLPKFLLLTLAVIGLSILPRLVAQTSEAAGDQAEEAAETPAESDAAPERNPNLKTPTAASKSLPILIGQEPLEFEKQPRGYPLAQLEVRDLAFSPDGQILAAAYGKWDTLGEVVVYEFSTKKVLKKFSMQNGVASVVFSKDGKYLAASIWNELIQIWDTATWELAAEKTTAGKVSRLAFSPDGKYLASGNEGGQLRLYTVGKWEEERDIKGDLFRLQKVAFSPDGKLLAAVGGSFDQPRFGRGLIFEVDSGKQIAKIETQGAPMPSAAFSPDGKELATGEYATAIRFWEVPTGKAISVLEIGGTMDTLEYTPDGLLVGPSYSGAVHIVKDRQVLRTFTGHEGRSLTARISPDGKTLVSGGIDAMIRLWNPETAAPTGTLRPHDVPEDRPEAVLAIAHSPDGRFVVTTHEDGTLRLRDANEGTFLKLLEGHEDVVAAVAFSPDSKILASGSYDHLVKLWNVETGEAIKDLKGHTNWVFSVAFSPDGKTLASSGYDKTIRLWNIENGEAQGTLEGHAAAARTLAFSPDGKQLVSAGSDRIVKLWDLAAQKAVHEMKGHTAAVRAVAFAPSGKKIASASEDQTIRFWSPETGQSLKELKGHTGMVWTLAFSPRGRTLASGGFDNTLRIWNAETGAALQSLAGHQDVITSLSYAPDTSSLITGSYDKTLKRWPTIEPPLPALVDLNIGDNASSPVVRFVVFTPDGTRMITGNQHHALRLWDLETGRVIKTVHTERGICDGALSPDGKLLATSDFGGNSILWNAETLEMIATLETGQLENLFLTFSPDGKMLATGNWSGEIKIWDALTREKIAELPKQELPVGGLAFSPDGSLLASGTGSYKEHQKPGTVKLWDTKTWKESANLPGPTMKMRRVQFSPDGKTLVAGGSQPELLVYDVPNRKLAVKLPVGTEAASMAFLPDSRTVVIGGYDGSVGLWSLDTRGRIARYEGHPAPEAAGRYVFDVAVSPDASIVASAGADGHVMLWPTSSQPPVKALASMNVKDAEAFSVALSPDGSRLAVATTTKTVEIRETKTGNVLHTISGLNTSCVSLSFAPDGKWIAGAAQSGWATVWNAETGEKLFSVEAHPGGARRAIFSPDGKLFATCGWDETAAVWNLPGGSLRYRTEKQGLSLSDVKFSPDGKLLITATGSFYDWQKPGSMKIWKADTGESFGSMGSHEGEIKGILFDGGGRYLISYGGNGAKVWDRMARKVLRSIGTATTITAAELSPDGNTLFTGDRSGRMMVYDVNTGNIKRTLVGHDALVYFVSSTPDGTVLASSSKDGTVKLWPGNKFPGLSPLAQELDDPQQSRTIAYSPDGKWLAVGGKKKTISLRDADTLDEVRKFVEHNGMLFRVVFTADSQSLLSSSSDGTVRLWNVASGKEIAKWNVHKEKLANVRGLALAPDGKRFAASNDNGEIVLWDLETRKELFRLANQSLPVTNLAFSPDGQLLATSTGDWEDWKKPGELKLWNAQTGEAIASLPGHSGEIKGVLFNRDGKLLISYGSDQSVRIWDVAAKTLLRKQDLPHNVASTALIGEETLLIGDVFGTLYVADLKRGILRQTRGHYAVLSEMAVSPTGTQFATVGHDGLFKTWSTEFPEPALRQLPDPKANDAARLAEKIRDWQPFISSNPPLGTMVRVKTLSPHGQKNWFAVYSPDGKTLATGGDDKTVKLWNAETMEPTLTLSGHEGYTTYAAFSPDGKTLASVALGNDKSVRLWDVATGRSLAVAEGHADGCRRVAFSPDGTQIASASEDGTVRVWDAKTLVQKLAIDLGLNVYSVAFSPDGKLLATGTGNWREKKNGEITLWNAETGERIKVLEKSNSQVYHLQFLKDGRHLLAAKSGVGLAVWNVESGEVEEIYNTLGYTRWIEISWDERRIVASHSLGMVTLWSRHESKPNLEFKASDGFIHAATFSPDGKRIIVADEASTLSVWELRETPEPQVVETTAAPAK